MTPFTTNLKRLRKEKGATQDDLAQQLHVTRQTVSSWETGRCQPDIQTLMALAEALDADVNELIYGTKPGEYPKFQRKYVIWTAVCGAIVVMSTVFWLVCFPYLRSYLASNSMYNAIPYIELCLPQICYFAGGIFIPSLVSLFYKIHIENRWRNVTIIIGIIFVLPPCFVIFYGLNIRIPMVNEIGSMVVYPAWRALFQYIFPFISGILIFAGFNSKG